MGVCRLNWVLGDLNGCWGHLIVRLVIHGELGYSSKRLEM